MSGWDVQLDRECFQQARRKIFPVLNLSVVRGKLVQEIVKGEEGGKVKVSDRTRATSTTWRSKIHSQKGEREKDRVQFRRVEYI